MVIYKKKRERERCRPLQYLPRALLSVHLSFFPPSIHSLQKLHQSQERCPDEACEMPSEQPQLNRSHVLPAPPALQA